MNNAESTMMYSNPVVSELNRIPNFDPLKYLKKTDNGLDIPLKFKKLWFRLKYPQGRVRVSNIRITDQLAIIEARVFFDRKDSESVSSYTASCDAKSAPNGQFLKYAQDIAIEQALNDAGFGIQFVSADGELASAVSVKTAPAQKLKAKVRESVASVTVPAIEKPEKAPSAAEKELPVTESPVIQSAEIKKAAYEEIAVETAAAAVEKMVPKETETSSSFAIAQESTESAAAQTAPVPSFTVPESEVETVVEEASKVSEPSAPTYTKDMSVEDICTVMTLEEAENYVVPSGACAGQKLSLVAERRRASLRYYINGYKGDDNILRAAASLIMAAHPELQES